MSSEGSEAPGHTPIPTRIITSAFWLFIILGIFELFLASAMVQSKQWGGTLPGGGIWDQWGTSVAPAFFQYLDLGFTFLMIASVLYLIRISLDAFVSRDIPSGELGLFMLAGLFLPSLVIYGNPGGVFYNISPIEFTLTAIVAPVYNFTFTGIWTVGAGVNITGGSYVLPWLDILLFGLGATQLFALKHYERERIGKSLIWCLSSSTL